MSQLTDTLYHNYQTHTHQVDTAEARYTNTCSFNTRTQKFKAGAVQIHFNSATPFRKIFNHISLRRAANAMFLVCIAVFPIHIYISTRRFLPIYLPANGQEVQSIYLSSILSMEHVVASILSHNECVHASELSSFSLILVGSLARPCPLINGRRDRRSRHRFFLTDHFEKESLISMVVKMIQCKYVYSVRRATSSRRYIYRYIWTIGFGDDDDARAHA